MPDDVMLVSYDDYHDKGNSVAENRRQALIQIARTLGTVTTASVSCLSPLAAWAKKPTLSQAEAFAAVRKELYDTSGSVSRLQAALDNQDFGQLLEMTKTMDQSLRKSVLGTAKKFVVDSEQGTIICNAVTFDLIGINRSSRPGQESAEQAAKYIRELRDDMEKMLELEPGPSEGAAA